MKVSHLHSNQQRLTAHVESAWGAVPDCSRSVSLGRSPNPQFVSQRSGSPRFLPLGVVGHALGAGDLAAR